MMVNCNLEDFSKETRRQIAKETTVVDILIELLKDEDEIKCT